MSGERKQQTIARPATVSGFGFFGGADVNVRFLPANSNHGIVFRRVDLTGKPEVAALIKNVVASPRRTTIRSGEATVEMVEHIMAALAGLRIDNVTVEIDAPEPPGCDGSCRQFCEELVDAGIIELSDRVSTTTICRPFTIQDDARSYEVNVRPHVRDLQAITYQLDYGRRSPVTPQLLSIELDTETFLREIAWARTFVLESEVQQLRRMGYGQRVTPADILVFGEHGVIDNQLRRADECVRHKILDCIGDFALHGAPIHGHFSAWRSGHGGNHQVIGQLANYTTFLPSDRVAA